jgi:hypothetical protein
MFHVICANEQTLMDPVSLMQVENNHNYGVLTITLTLLVIGIAAQNL